MVLTSKEVEFSRREEVKRLRTQAHAYRDQGEYRKAAEIDRQLMSMWKAK